MHARTQKYTRTQAHMLLNTCLERVNTHTRTHAHTSRYGEHARQQTATQAHLVCIDAIIFNKSSPHTYLSLTLTLQSSHWSLNSIHLHVSKLWCICLLAFMLWLSYTRMHACIHKRMHTHTDIYRFVLIYDVYDVWYINSVYFHVDTCVIVSIYIWICLYIYIHIHVVICMYISADVDVDV